MDKPTRNLGEYIKKKDLIFLKFLEKQKFRICRCTTVFLMRIGIGI